MVIASGVGVGSQLFSSGLIGLREGLECGIVVTILLAFLKKSDRFENAKWVWAGVLGAVVMTVGTFAVIHFGTQTFSQLTAEAVAGVASLIAAVIVTAMILWMRKAARSISGELKSGMAKALELGPQAVVTLAFLAVGREGLETALLMVNYAETGQNSTWAPFFGLILGILAAVVLTALIYYGAVTINFQRFFKYTGVLLVFVAAGILTYAIHAFDVVGWFTLGNQTAWDISSWWRPSSWYATVAQGIFNFVPAPTVAQVVAWFAYLAIVLPLFLRPTRAAPSSPTTTVVETADETDAAGQRDPFLPNSVPSTNNP